MMYPREHFATPLDDQEIQEAARQRRLRIIARMQGPEEREYAGRKVEPVPGWAVFLFAFALALTVSGILYVVHSVMGVPGVIGMIVCAALVGCGLALTAIAQQEEPKP
jgi:hypothetical protein